MRRVNRCRKALAKGRRYVSRMPDAREVRERKRWQYRLIQAIYRRLKQFGEESPIARARREKESTRKRAKTDQRGRQRAYRLTEEQRRDEKARHRQNRKLRHHGGGLSQGIRRRLWERQSGRCALCCAQLERVGVLRYHLDHIVPLARGGMHHDQNVQLLCPSCNIWKGTKSQADCAILLLEPEA